MTEEQFKFSEPKRTYLIDIIDENVRLKAENGEFKRALMELKKIGDYQEGRIKELNDENDQLQEELLQCKAVIDNRWSEYLKKKEEQENG